jgi:hypothetical protein
VIWFAALFAAFVVIGLRRAQHGFSSHLLLAIFATTALLGSFVFSLGR